MSKKSFFVSLISILVLSFVLLAGCGTTPPPAQTESQAPASAPAAVAPQVATITIVNSTGYTVYAVYMSPHDASSYGDDLLASDQILLNGQSFVHQLPLPLSETYDISLIDEDIDSYSKWDIRISDGDVIVFTFDDYDR